MIPTRRLVILVSVIASFAVPLPSLALRIPNTWRGSSSSVSNFNPHNTRRLPRQTVQPDRAVLRNHQREIDLKAISAALFQYRTDHGDLPAAINANDQEICRLDAKSCAGLLDLRSDLLPYAQSLPVDPTQPSTSNGTGYMVRADWRGKFYLTAPRAEAGWQPIRLGK